MNVLCVCVTYIPKHLSCFIGHFVKIKKKITKIFLINIKMVWHEKYQLNAFNIISGLIKRNANVIETIFGMAWHVCVCEYAGVSFVYNI